MRKSKLITGIVIMVLALAGTAFGAYKYGHDHGYATGYSAAPSPDYYKEDQYGILKGHVETLQQENKRLQTEYDDLYSKIGITAQQKRPVSCNSYSYGINDQFTSTSCY